MGRRWPGLLPAVLAAFVLLAGLYSLVVPVFEGPDEIWHFAFANHLAEGRGLPRLNAAEPDIWLRNAAHPPLYYLLVAAVIAPLDRSDFPAQYHFNLASPHITPGASSDRPNLLVHPLRETFPYRQSVLAVHLARLVSVGLGALALWGVWEAAWRLLRRQPACRGLALAATALAAAVPQFVYGSAVINNDALATAAAIWTLVALLEVMNSLSWRWAMAAGLGLGIALLSKLGMVAILPLPALALAIANAQVVGGWLGRVPWLPPEAPSPSLRPRSRYRASAAAALCMYGVPLVVAGWWYARNWLLYGDPLAWHEWVALAGASRATPNLAQFLGDMRGLFGTYWADFGLRADRNWAWLFAVVVLAAAIGLVLRLARRDWPPLHLAGLLLGLAWFLLLLASAARYALLITDIHGRLLYPGLAVAGLALALGLTGWGPRAGRWVAGLGAGTLALFALAAPLALIRPAFARPLAPDGALPAGTQPREATFGSVVALAGYRLGEKRLRPGAGLPVTAYFRLAPGTPSQPDVSAVAALIRPDGQAIGRAEALLGTSVYPASVWLPGDMVEMRLEVPVASNLDGSTVADVWLSVTAGAEALPPDGSGDHLSLGTVAVSVPGPCAVAANVGQSFGGEIELVGYRRDAGGVALCWRAVRAPRADYTVFVHVFDASGVALPGADGMPRHGLYPTSAWLPGEQILDRHDVDLPPGARLTVGLYRAEDGQRLSVDGTDSTEVELGP